MAKLKQNIYIIQKFVKAHTLSEALEKERKGTIVDICLATGESKPLVSAVGFQIRPDGNENIDYD